jgi:extracellular elastinolytic metalloproteinase
MENAERSAGPNGEQMNALDYTRQQMPNLMARFDHNTGVTKVLFNRGGYLTSPNSSAEIVDLAIGFVSSNATALGLTSGDVFEYRVQDLTYTNLTGATRVFMQQMLDGIPVYQGLLQVNVNREGRVISVNNGYMPDLEGHRNAAGPVLDAVEAALSAAIDLGYTQNGLPRAITRPAGSQLTTTVEYPLISREPLTASLMYLPIHGGEARLVWNFQVQTHDTKHWFDYTVDAITGKVWTRFDWVAAETYRVYPAPVESPIHTSPAPPADARQDVGIPHPPASPNGWHDTGSTQYTITRGNNVNAYEDGNNSNSPGLQPDCGGSLDCLFGLDLTQGPNSYESAAVTNLFYWNNIIHDVTYVYGFDEAGGNFQTNNFGNGGSGNDEVQAEAQDGGGTNNANFATPPDGSRPRMQMYLWTGVTPNRDGDLDNGIIIHEYGHGISNRLVGGPSASSCLSNTQQPGEGLSDWWSLFFTGEVGDTGADRRGVGTYALNQAPDGPGIRTQPYSTDPGINTHTYQSIRNMAVPHGVGEVWAQIAWECYWALVDTYGFDANLYDPFGGAGNQRMMLYVIEGLKNTTCSPTFADVRDGIIQAATDNYGGADVCILWKAFAATGLGVDADPATSSSRNVTDGFAEPAECQCSPQPIADAGPNQVICVGGSATIGTPAQAGNTYSWSPGGQTTAQITVSPAVTTTYTLTATTSCGSTTDTVTVVVDDGSGGGLNEDFEGGVLGWTATGLWHLVNNSSCASPGYSSATHAFYYGQDSSCDYATGSATSGTLTSPEISGITASSTLDFDYYRVVESYSGAYDKTEVAIVSGGSATTVWALDSSTASTAAWQAAPTISLASYAGQVIQIRFTFDSGDGVSNNFTGWLVDDVVVSGESPCGGNNTPPVVNISSPSDPTTVIEGDSVTFTATANDAEDGDLTASLGWSSNLDGNIGSGGSFSTTALSIGTHTITASATDSGNLTGSDTVTVTVNPCTPQPVADAGADQNICSGDSVTLGSPAQAGHAYSWSPGGQTTAQITVSPGSTTTYTVTATTACGTASDSVSVTVSSSSVLLSDDFESGAIGWTGTGLWHLVDNTNCASPGYSSATHAWYYGQDSSCDYNAGNNSGELTSPTISGITANTTLSFDFYRQVESYSGSYDRTEVQVVSGATVTTIWSRDSSDASAAAWGPSGALSLAAYAGQNIQIRFSFNTVDGSFNNFTGWLIDDVVVANSCQ